MELFLYMYLYLHITQHLTFITYLVAVSVGNFLSILVHRAQLVSAKKVHIHSVLFIFLVRP